MDKAERERERVRVEKREIVNCDKVFWCIGFSLSCAAAEENAAFFARFLGIIYKYILLKKKIRLCI